MRSSFAGVSVSAIADAVASDWQLSIDELRYLPEGGGAYHWVASCGGEPRWFVTVDDLDTKPWLGADRDTVFAGLCAAYRAAADLRASGCAFVVAPMIAASDAVAVRLDDRHSVSVFEYVDGVPGRWGQSPPLVEVRDVVTMLAELHRRTSVVDGLSVRGLEVPDRGALDLALGALGSRWDGGPLSEAARAVLAAQAESIVEWLAELDRWSATFDGGTEVVVSHGEPHPGNLVRTARGVLLVDWDTVALARPERDLWMLADLADDVALWYHELTGRTLDRDALVAYRLLWALADVAAFTVQLRGEHRDDADAQKALGALDSIFGGGEPAPYGAVLP
jgi:spectinomycin phosphotransferase